MASPPRPPPPPPPPGFFSEPTQGFVCLGHAQSEEFGTIAPSLCKVTQPPGWNGSNGSNWASMYGICVKQGKLDCFGFFLKQPEKRYTPQFSGFRVKILVVFVQSPAGNGGMCAPKSFRQPLGGLDWWFGGFDPLFSDCRANTNFLLSQHTSPNHQQAVAS